MLVTFVATAKMLIRTPALVVWSLVFPIALATIFVFMFSSIEEADSFDAVSVAVVADDAYEESGFSRAIAALGEQGERASSAEAALLSVREVETEAQARELVEAGEVSGAFSVGEDGVPTLIVSTASSALSTNRAQIDATILQSVADAYAQNAVLVADAARENPAAFARVASARSLDGISDAAAAGSGSVEVVSITHSEPQQTVRYYYALIGLTVLISSNVALIAICQMQPNLSSLGARRTVGALGRGRALAATLAACWLLTCASLMAAFLYIRFVLGVDFGGRETLCLVGIAAGALFSTALGTAVGAIPRLSVGVKSGILTALACFASLFAGLYGQPAMELADSVARAAPMLAAVNPAKALSDVFYSLYCYDSLWPFAQRAAVLVASSVVLFAIAAVLVRRQRYEHL